MSLTPNQQKFASVFAGETGLNPKVVGAWLLAEQSGSAAQNYEHKGYNNWLNIARTDSGDAPGSHTSVWKDPIKAAQASAAWIKGQGPIAQSYGKPSSGIKSILSSAGQAPHRQIQAISRSGWASSGYEGGHVLSQLLGQANVPNALPSGARAMISSKAPGENPNATGSSAPTLDAPRYAAALQEAEGARSLGSLFGGKKPGDEALRESFEHTPLPAERDYMTQGGMEVINHPGQTVVAPRGLGHYDILPKGAPVLGYNRKDQGRDLQLKPGQQLVAPGDYEVVRNGSDPSGFGPSYPILRVLTGRYAGHNVYYGHTDSLVKPGQRGKAGDVVAKTSITGHNAPPGWLEFGFAPHGTPGTFGQPAPF